MNSKNDNAKKDLHLGHSGLVDKTASCWIEVGGLIPHGVLPIIIDAG